MQGDPGARSGPPWPERAAFVCTLRPPRRFAPRVLCRQAASKAVILPAIPRATGIGAANGCYTRSEDPALLTELAQKPSSAPAPLAESLRDLNASLLLFPCPATPDPMRHTHRVNACRRLVCRVTPRPAVGGVLGVPWCRASGFASRDARLFCFFGKIHAADWRLSEKRAQERESGVHAIARTLTDHTHPPPSGPRQ